MRRVRASSGPALHALVTVSLVPAFLLLAPASDWSNPVLIVVLFSLAVIAARHDVPLPSGIKFDATAPLALIAVAIVGPLPALVATFPPSLLGKRGLWRAGNLANLAAYGWYILAGALMLGAFEPNGLGETLGWLLTVGLVQLLINWVIGPAIYGTLWLGQPLHALVGMLRDAFPAAAVMAILAGLTVILYDSIGLAALGLFALVAVVPQTALTLAARTRLVAGLDPLTAARSYGAALAEQLDLDRGSRRDLDSVIRLAYERDGGGDPVAHIGHTVLDPSEVSCAAGHVTEWWNGSGGPAGLAGELIPYPARIAEVARTWAALTAGGGPQINQLDALSHLDEAAGLRLDPLVVDAAHSVVAHERLAAPEAGLLDPRMPPAIRRVFQV